MDFVRENDTRDVWLRAEEIARLLDACDPWFRPFALTALSTGAGRLPLMRLLVRDVKVIFDKKPETFSGSIYLPARLEDRRPRAVANVDPICQAPLPLCAGKEPNDHIFYGPADEGQECPAPITAFQVRYWFEVDGFEV